MSTLVVFVSGFYLGMTNSPLTTLSAITGKMQFLLAYLLEVFTYLTFALLIGTLIRKTGFSVIILLLYLIVEPIVGHYLPDSFVKYLPLNAMNHVIWSPNTSLMQVKTPEFDMDFQTAISIGDVGICLMYAMLFSGILYFYLQKKDL
jgi:ABC-type transport system involved in multi-copper enzyme maturation permease subunit